MQRKLIAMGPVRSSGGVEQQGILPADFSGKIHTMLLNYRSGIDQPGGIIPQLIQAAAAHTQVVIFHTGGEAKRDLETMVAPYRNAHDIVLLFGGLHQAWLRDYLIPLRKGAGDHVVYSVSRKNAELRYLLETLSLHLEVQGRQFNVARSPEVYYFDYGDVRADESEAIWTSSAKQGFLLLGTYFTGTIPGI